MPAFSYTAKDYEALVREMKSKVPVLAPDWTNLNEGDLGMALIHLVAGVGDMLAFYLDRQAEEVFLPTAFSREAVQRLVRLVDYRLSRPVAAWTTLRFSLPSPAVSNITIPKFTQCKTQDGLYFVTKEEVVLYAGETMVEVDAFQGQFVRDTFTGTGASVQTFQLTRPNVAENFLEVTVGSRLWTEDREDVSYDDSELYEVNVGTDGRATLRFSSYLGTVPPQNVSITAEYLETRGEEGNIGSGKVTEIVTSIDGGGELSVTNTTVASGGKARESIEEAKLNAPRRLRTLNRAVTLRDYVDLLEMFPKVAKAQAINHSGYVECYVAPEGGGQLYVEAPVIELGAVSSGQLTAGTYQVRVTAKDSYGETLWWEYNPSDRSVLDRTQSIAVASNAAIKVTITNPTGAKAFNVYVSNDGGSTWYAAAADFEADDSGTTEFYIDEMPETAATLPSVNTTGVRSESGSGSLKNSAESYLEVRRTVGTVFALFNPKYRQIDVTATVRVYDNYRQSQVEGAVRNAITEFFAFENREFGETIYYSDLIRKLMDVDGVWSVNLADPSADVGLSSGEIATVGEISLTMIGGS